VKQEIDQAVDAGTKFCNLFYETFDKSRHVKTAIFIVFRSYMHF